MITRRWARAGSCCIAVLTVSAACASTATPSVVDEPARNPGVVVDEAMAPEASSDATSLYERPGPRPETSGSVPHIQLDASPVHEIDAELRRRAFLIPGVEERPSVISLPGAVGLVVADDIELQRADVLGGRREFAHIHPDGSLHVWLPIDLASEVQEFGWGERHPWAERDGFWDGVALVFTPETPQQLDVVSALVIEAYNFVVGAELSPADIDPS